MPQAPPKLFLQLAGVDGWGPIVFVGSIVAIWEK